MLLQQITLKKLKASVLIYFAKLGSVEEAHTFCEELALKKVRQARKPVLKSI